MRQACDEGVRVKGEFTVRRKVLKGKRKGAKRIFWHKSVEDASPTVPCYGWRF